MKKKLKGSPAWLHLTADRMAFIFDEARALIVRKIFEETISGIGANALAKRFNSLGVPPFGPAPYWQQSTISNILANRATVGEFIPLTKSNGKVVGRGKPIPNYYPVVVSEEIFKQAVIARRQGIENGRGGQVSNLFSSLVRCSYCGSRMKFENVSYSSSPRTGGQYYVCTKAFKERVCVRLRWRREDFEQSFVEFLSSLADASVVSSELTELIEAANFQQSSDPYLARSIFASRVRRQKLAIEVSLIGVSAVNIAAERLRSRTECIEFINPDRSLIVSSQQLGSWHFHPQSRRIARLSG